MKILFIINDPPYGTERCVNAMPQLAKFTLTADQVLVF